MRFIGIMGATGVGKSSAAVALAKKINGEIISADSMQIYRGMDIGTAKITTAEADGVVHHMLDIVDVNCQYSAHDYMVRANSIIDDVLSRGKVPIVVGGTGLYFYSLLYGLDHSNSSDTDMREQLTTLYDNEGIDGLVDRLRAIDPQAIDSIDCHNYKRVMRAIEIACSGGSVTNNEIKLPIVDAKIFVLNKSRQTIYDNIDNRVDSMLANGLLQEVTALYQQYHDNKLQSLQAIGYKEIISCIDGMCEMSQAVDDLKRNTRRYAKRQLSYFRRLPATWIDCENLAVVDVVECMYKLVCT